MAQGSMDINVKMNATQAIQALNNLTNSVNKVSNQLGGAPREGNTAFNKFFGNVNKGFQMAFGAGVADLAIGTMKAIAVDTIKTGVEFESTMSKVGAIMGATGGEMEQLEKTARHWGATTRFSATESAEALTYMGMAGWSSQEAMAGLGGVLHLAQASGMDLAKTSDIVTDNLTAFGLSANDSARYADALAYASANANVNVDNMGEALKYVAPVSEALGISMEETVAMVSKLGDAGIKGSQAGTTLRSVLSNLASGSGDAGKAMEQLGINIQDSNGHMKPMSQIIDEINMKTKGMTDTEKAHIAQMIAGKTAMSGFLALLGQGGASVAGFTNELRNSTGTAEQMAKTMDGNVKGAWLGLKSAMEELKISMFEANAEGIEGMLQGLTKLVNKLSGTKSEAEQFKATWGEAMSESTAESLTSIKTISDGFHMLDLAIAQTGNITKSQTDQMMMYYKQLQEQAIADLQKLKDDSLMLMDEQIAKATEKERDGLVKQREEKAKHYDEAISKMQEANGKQLDELQKYIDKDGVISKEGYEKLKQSRDKYLKDKIDSTVKSGAENNSAVDAILKGETKVTKDNYKTIVSQIKQAKEDTVKLAEAERDKMKNVAEEKFRVLGSISESEYRELLSQADEYFDGVKSGAEGQYKSAMDSMMEKVSATGVTTNSELAKMIYKWKTTRDEMSKKANPKVDTSNLSIAERAIQGVKNMWNNLFNRSARVPHINVPKVQVRTKSAMRSLSASPMRAEVGASTTNNYPVHFQGSYNFRDRSDIDYMLEETGKKLRRKR